MAGKKGTGISNKELNELIRQELPAKDIIEKADITLQTLQKKVGLLGQKERKLYSIDGLYDEAKPIKFSSRGIFINQTRFIDSSFDEDDTFELEYDDKVITLTKN